MHFLLICYYLHWGNGLVELLGVFDAGDPQAPHRHEGVVLGILQNELGCKKGYYSKKLKARGDKDEHEFVFASKIMNKEREKYLLGNKELKFRGNNQVS